jgi:hypothetical protein
MGLRERLSRKKVAKLCRSNAAQCDELIKAEVSIRYDLESETAFVPAHPVPLESLVSWRGRWLQAAGLVEAGQWTEAQAIMDSIKAEAAEFPSPD